MIVDSIENASLYAGLSSRLDTGFAWLKETDLSAIALGEHRLSDGMRAIVQEYVTIPETNGKYEAHRKFIDIQYVIRGTESMLVQKMSALLANSPYDSDNDVVFFLPERDGSQIVVQSGDFVVFFPHDAHMPMVAAGSPAEVKKVVLKVPV